MPFPIAAAGAAIQGLTGLIQLGGGLLTKKPKRPDYEIQSEYQKNVGLAQGVKNYGGMDKASYQQALQNIGRMQSAGLGMFQDRRSAMQGVGQLVQRSNDSLLNLDSMNARMAQQNFLQGSRLEMGANSALGAEKKAKFQWDKLQPYLDKVNQRNAMIGSGMQNIAGAAQSLALLGAGKDLGSIGGKKTAGVNATNAALAADAMADGTPISRKRIAATTGGVDNSFMDYDFISNQY